MKNQQRARADSRRKGSRVAIIVIGSIVAVVAIAWGANTFFGDDDNADQPTEPTTGETIASDERSTDTASESSAGGVTDETTGEFIPDGCPPPQGTTGQTQTFDEAPPACLDPTVSYSALVSTNKGDIIIELDQDKAPKTVNNFVFLARNRYFDDTTCHRIIPGFVVQCGDPDATGTGGPGYVFPDELPEPGEYRIGSIAMANSGPDSNGSQFFIITGENGAALPPAYSLFGAVIDGFDETVVSMEAVGTQSGSPSEPVEINSVTILVD